MEQKLRQSVFDLLNSGASDTEVRKFIRDKSSWGKTKSNEMFNKWKSELVEFGICENIENFKVDVLDFKNKLYTYNRELDQYVIELKCRSKPLLLNGGKHRAICRDYSAWHSDLTAVEICRKFSLTPEIFNEYRKIFGLTKDREPLSEEEVLNSSIEESVEAVLEQKRYAIYQEYEKKDWKEVQAEAEKWRKIKNNISDIAKSVLDGWYPKQYSKIASPKFNKTANHTLLISGNDWHIGEAFKKEKGFSGQEFNSDIAAALINNYADQIEESVNSRKYLFKECCLILNGDILNSCFNGKTHKGTELHNDKINAEMFEVSLNITTLFIERLAKIFPKLTVVGYEGNHDAFLLSILFSALKAYFRNNINIKLEMSKSWCEVRRFGNIATLISHGGSAYYKTAFPTSPVKLKSYVQDLFLARPELFEGCQQKIVVTGHYHRFWQQDMGSFDFYCFGGLPIGGHFEDEMNLRSSARQNALVLSENKVLESLHFYF